jgi:hypothetical protein
MNRLNLTLDHDTASALEQHSRRGKMPRAAVARELIREAIQHRDRRERLLRLASDYTAGRGDAAKLLDDMELAQLEILERA